MISCWHFWNDNCLLPSDHKGNFYTTYFWNGKDNDMVCLVAAQIIQSRIRCNKLTIRKMSFRFHSVTYCLTLPNHSGSIPLATALRRDEGPRVEVSSQKIFIGWWTWSPWPLDLGVLWRVGRAGRLHTIDRANSKEARTLGTVPAQLEQGGHAPESGPWRRGGWPGTCSARPAVCSGVRAVGLLEALWSKPHVEVSKKDSCPQRNSFFLSEWVRLTLRKFCRA